MKNYLLWFIDRDKTKGNVIEGSIDVKEDGYFKLFIPYDKGFEVYVDVKRLLMKLLIRVLLTLR